MSDGTAYIHTVCGLISASGDAAESAAAGPTTEAVAPTRAGVAGRGEPGMDRPTDSSGPPSSSEPPFDAGPAASGLRGSGSAHAAKNADAIQRSIDMVSAAGGGVVRIPSGSYAILPIELRSDVILDLAPTAVLFAWPRIADYPGYQKDATTGGRGKYSLISAHGCRRCGISGIGTIDGNGEAFWDEPLRTLASRGHTRESLGLPAYGEDDSPFWRPVRPRPSPLVEFNRCIDVRVADVRIAGSPGWTLHLLGCRRVWVERITIANSMYGPNTDGIDINGCRDVVIHGCDITCGDDAVIVKAFADAGSSEHITVSQCVLRTHCAALGIGAEVEKPIRNIVFSDCVVPKALRILQIELWTAGLVENVVVSNIAGDTMTDIPLERPIYIDVQHHGRSDGALGHVRNVVVSGMVAQTRGRIVMTAADGATIEDVTLRDIQLRVPEIEDPESSVPTSRSSQMSNDSPQTRSKRAFVVADNVHRLLVDGFSIRPPSDNHRIADDAEHGVDFRATNGLNDDRRKIAATGTDTPMGLFHLRRCRQVRIRAPFAEPYGSAKRLECTECDQIVDD